MPVGGADVDQSVPVADRLLHRYGAGSVASLSFDKGFTRAEDHELLSLYVPTVVMPQRGRKTDSDTAREHGKKFVALRRQHRAVESAINALEHHGLNRCLDVGLAGYRRDIGYGVRAYNLHVVGRERGGTWWERRPEAGAMVSGHRLRQARCRCGRRFWAKKCRGVVLAAEKTGW